MPLCLAAAGADGALWAAPGADVQAVAQPAAAVAASRVVEPSSYCRLVDIVVHDGDTLTAEVWLPFGGALRPRPIRLRGYDAWESTTARRTVGAITPAELAKGKRAAAACQQLLCEADAVYLAAEGTPRFTYERLLGVLWIDPPGPDAALVNVGDWLREKGHARPTDPILLKRAKAREKAARKKVAETLFRAK